MLNIINRGRVIASSFYDKDGVYWTIDKMVDDTDEYLILLLSKNGDKELFTLKKEMNYICKYELGILDDDRPHNKRMYKLRTYIPIEDIKDSIKFIGRLAEQIEAAKNIV